MTSSIFDDFLRSARRGWAYLETALSKLTEADAGRPVMIRNERHTLVQAIERRLTH